MQSGESSRVKVAHGISEASAIVGDEEDIGNCRAAIKIVSALAALTYDCCGCPSGIGYQKRAAGVGNRGSRTRVLAHHIAVGEPPCCGPDGLGDDAGGSV